MKYWAQEIETSRPIRGEARQAPHPLGRRRFLHLVAGAAALPALSRFARAQAYPSRPVRVVVGFAAAGSTDIAARLISQWLSERLGQQFVVENRPGAGSNIAAEAAIRAPADGYILFMAASPNAINATLYEKLKFNFIHDTAPVAGIMRFPLVIDVNPSVPAKTVLEFIAYAKANPGKISMGSGGVGSPQHISGELFKMMTGVDLVHVPYRGGAPAVADLLGGQLQVMFDVLPESIEHIKAGKLRSLAVTTTTRSESLPDVPTVSEFVPDFEASAWEGLVAPKNTPSEIVNKLNAEINAGLTDPRIKAKFAELGSTVIPGSSTDFGKLIAEDTEKWAKVVKFAGLKAD